MQNCKTLRQPLMGELAMSPEERGGGESEKMPFIVATYVYASSQGQRTHVARTKIPKIVAYLSCSADHTHFAQTKMQLVAATTLAQQQDSAHTPL